MNMEVYKKTFDYIVNKVTNKTNDEISNDITLEYYNFVQNFTKYLGINPYSELSDYTNQVLDYLDKTFPFSFMKVDNKNVEEAIKLYVLSLGGTLNHVPYIIELLKQTKMKHIDKKYIKELLDQDQIQIVEDDIELDHIIGSSVSKYQNNNLYEILENIHDKNINGYISYLINNNVFSNEQQFKKVFSGISITKDSNGNTYVNEGNHRIFTYIALLKIRDFFNVSTDSKHFKASAVIYKSIELYPEETNPRGK